MVAMRDGAVWVLVAFLCFLAGCAFFSDFGLRRQRTEPEITLRLTEQDRTVELSFEDYVAGVVAAEMDTDWPREALGAQAILARTYAWRKMQEGGEHERYGTDASDDVTSFQAYDMARVNDRVREAVEDTRGEILVHDGQPALTWFHAASGGLTCDPEEGLEYTNAEKPYYRTVQEPEGAQLRFWEETFAEDEIASALHDMGYDISSIDEMTVQERGPSGRAVRLRVNETSVSAPSFRVSLDSDRLKSTMLKTVEVSDDGSVQFSGVGHGHGVGLSQEGARALADEGRSAEDIIRYYYTDIDIMQIWP